MLRTGTLTFEVSMRMRSIVTVTLFVFSGGLVTQTGCAAMRPPCEPGPRDAAVVTIPGDPMNPNEEGHSLPTVVRILQVRSLNEVRAASFEELWQGASERLGDDLLSEDEVTVYPHEHGRHPAEISPEARYVVGVALVRRPTGNTWWSAVRLPDLSECAEEDEARAPELRFSLHEFTIHGELRWSAGPARGADSEG